MSTKHRPARSYTATLALATNEKGVVITSAPSLTPTARRARWRPVVPDETALPKRAPGARQRRVRTAAHGAPARADRSAAPRAPARSSGSPSTGRASGIGVSGIGPARPDLASAVTTTRAPRPCAPAGDQPGMPCSSESTSASHDASITFVETPMAPHSCSPSDESSRTRVIASLALAPSRMRTLKFTSLIVSSSGYTRASAPRSALSSALTGPLPSAVNT